MSSTSNDALGGEFGDLEARWRAAASRPADAAIDRWAKVVNRELAAERRQESFRFWTAAAALLVLGWHLGFAAAALPDVRSVLWSAESDLGSPARQARRAVLAELGVAHWTNETAPDRPSPM